VSLRARLLIAAVVLVAVGLLAANLATYRVLSHFLIQRVDSQLEQAQVPAAVALFGRGPGDHRGGPVLPGGTYAEWLDPSGNFLASTFFGLPGQRAPRLALPPNLPGSTSSAQETRSFTANARGGVAPHYRVVATSIPEGQGTLVVAIPLLDYAATLHSLVFVEVLVSVIVLFGVAVLALWLVRVGLRPLEGIGTTAGAIAAGDLTRRVEPADERTEIGRLGIALNAMLAQIEAAFEERRASERRLRRFVADASHELRTPLTSIRGYAELFRRGADSRPEDLAKSMQRIEAEAARMGVLVDDLLLLARLDQGRPLDREPVDVGRVAAEAVESARAIEPDRPIDLFVDGPVEMTGDQSRLRQVLDNLLDNARVHTPAGTPIQVRVESHDHEIRLSVADGGPGLADGVAGRVFERFYRGDPARSRTTGGAGLGLSIVAAIVHAHGGSVTAANAKAGGAAFEIRLPVRGGDPAGSPSEPPDGPVSGEPPR